MLLGDLNAEPDTPEMRADWVRYYNHMTLMDEQIAAKLKREGRSLLLVAPSGVAGSSSERERWRDEFRSWTESDPDGYVARIFGPASGTAQVLSPMGSFKSNTMHVCAPRPCVPITPLTWTSRHARTQRSH